MSESVAIFYIVLIFVLPFVVSSVVLFDMHRKSPAYRVKARQNKRKGAIVKLNRNTNKKD
jgi:hypothetical protein